MLKLAILLVLTAASPVLRAQTPPIPPTPTPTPTSPTSAKPVSPKGLAAENSKRIDKELADGAVAVAEVEACFGAIGGLRSSLAAKKQQLSTEFKGKVPEAFTPLLAGKTARLTKAKQRCVDRSAAVGGQLDGIMQLFRTLEPPSPNMKTQRASVVELNKRLIAAVERENPRAGAKKAAAPKDAEAGQ